MTTKFPFKKSSKISRKSTIMRPTRFTRFTVIGTCLSVLAVTTLVAAPSRAADPSLPNLASTEPLPLSDPTATVDTYVGQSIQVRQDADGNPNSNLIDFRWAATQVNAEADKAHNTSIPLPMADAPMLRSLIGSSGAPDKVENGVEYNFNELTGVEVKRTLNLWPQEKELPVDVKAEFLLDGQKVEAADIVGKGGKLQATYVITNNTLKKQSVRYKNLDGKMATDTVETSQPFVAIGEQLIPQTWGRFNQGTALVGADGRGNFQAQWVGLPFAPLNKDGKATFQWSAQVPEGQGVIPKMLINVAPIYIPSDNMIPKQPGLPAVNPPGLGQIESGAGVALMGGKEVVTGIIELIGAIGQGRNVVAAKLPGAISDTKSAVAKLEKTLAPFANEKIPTLPQTIQRLQTISANLTALSADLRANGNNSQKVKELQKDLALAGAGVEAIDLYVNAANNYTQVTQNTKNTLTQRPVDPNVCEQATKDITGLALRAQCLFNKELVMGTHLEVDTALNVVGDTLLATSAALPKLVGDLEADGIDDVNGALKDITSQLQDFQIFLTGTLLPQVKGVTNGAGEIFAAIQAGIDTIKKDAAPGAKDIKQGIGERLVPVSGSLVRGRKNSSHGCCPW